MNESEQAGQRDRDERHQAPAGRGNDDRRSEVKPTDRAVPRSPEPEEDSVRKGWEKLERVKPY
jgi:hypothetical protein